MTSSPTPGRTLVTNAPSWERNALPDKFPCWISTLGIFLRLSYYPVQLCSQGCWTCLNTPTVSLFFFSLLACCRMIPIRIGLGKTFCREEKYWKLGGHSSFAVKLLGNFQKIRTQQPRNGLLVSKQQRGRRHQNVTLKMNFFLFHLSSILFHLVLAVICRLLANFPWIDRKELIQVQILVVGLQCGNTLCIRGWDPIRYLKTEE